jgi:hypothetical protein
MLADARDGLLVEWHGWQLFQSKCSHVHHTSCATRPDGIDEWLQKVIERWHQRRAKKKDAVNVFEGGRERRRVGVVKDTTLYIVQMRKRTGVRIAYGRDDRSPAFLKSAQNTRSNGARCTSDQDRLRHHIVLW